LLRRAPFALVRERAGLAVEDLAPHGCAVVSAGKRENENETSVCPRRSGKMMVTFDRGKLLAVAYVIAKGQYDAVKARGLRRCSTTSRG